MEPKTYPEYMKAFGREKGREKWREYKKELEKEATLQPIENVEVKILPHIYSEKEGLATAFERGSYMAVLVNSSAWIKYLKPQIEKDTSDFVRIALNSSGETKDKALGAAGYGEKLLRTIRRWIQDAQVAEKIMLEKGGK